MATARSFRGWVPYRLKRLCFALLAVILGLAAFEGLCSLGLLSWDLVFRSKRPVAERVHTDYDEELGWVHRPSVRIKDLYGPGRTLTINAQGFRATRDYPVEVPEGKVRILASGDSFTLGYGVGDADTWCAALERTDPRLEIVNMGQGGYGLDQMYLWFRRDGRKIAHQIHLFACVSQDIYRMQSDRFMGYGKPTLKLDGEIPVADHVPVPRRAYVVPWITQNRELIDGLRSLQLISRGFEGDERTRLSFGETSELMGRAMQVMHRDDLEHGSRLVFVWLPTRAEYARRENDVQRRAGLARLAVLGIITIDLVPDLRQVPEARVGELFISVASGIDFPGAAGHYTKEGAEFVAARLNAHLRAVPELAGILR